MRARARRSRSGRRADHASMIEARAERATSGGAYAATTKPSVSVRTGSEASGKLQASRLPAPAPPARAAPRVGQAGVGAAAQATRNRRVNVVVSRLELDPAVFWKVDLDPRVSVIAADDVAVDRALVCARSEAVHEPGRDPERPEHVTHRGGEELAVTLLGVEKEVSQRICSGRRSGRVERVGETWAAEVRLDGRRLVIRRLGASFLHHVQSELVNPFQDGGAAVTVSRKTRVCG